jgi:hypothetical protein
MKKSNISRGLIMLLLVSICALSFQSSERAVKTDTVQSAKPLFIDPENMQQGGYYYYWDHGSGAMVAQYDRYENGTIYNTNSITPAQGIYSQNSSISVYDAGNITVATLSQILHLLRCILAGLFVL